MGFGQCQLPQMFCFDRVPPAPPFPTPQELDEALSKKDKLTVVFSAMTWCRPCKSMQRPAQKLAAHYKEGLRVVKIFGNSNQQTKELFKKVLKVRHMFLLGTGQRKRYGCEAVCTQYCSSTKFVILPDSGVSVLATWKPWHSCANPKILPRFPTPLPHRSAPRLASWCSTARSCYTRRQGATSQSWKTHYAGTWRKSTGSCPLAECLHLKKLHPLPVLLLLRRERGWYS